MTVRPCGVWVNISYLVSSVLRTLLFGHFWFILEQLYKSIVLLIYTEHNGITLLSLLYLNFSVSYQWYEPWKMRVEFVSVRVTQ